MTDVPEIVYTLTDYQPSIPLIIKPYQKEILPEERNFNIQRIVDPVLSVILGQRVRDLIKFARRKELHCYQEANTVWEYDALLAPITHYTAINIRKTEKLVPASTPMENRPIYTMNDDTPPQDYLPSGDKLLRSRCVGKFIAAVFPTLSPDIPLKEGFPETLFYARRTEQWAYEASTNLNDYCIRLARKLNAIQRSMGQPEKFSLD